MNTINESTSVSEVVKACPNARHIFDRHGLKGCGGEHGPSESLSFFATVHQVNVDELIREINREMESPSAQPYVYKETLPDYIYRRFFKAGVLTVLTVGCLWGAVNLLQIALGKNFLQLRLLPSIHAHAHAMIFGWVGMFVMGFAYQSFPRFKEHDLVASGSCEPQFLSSGGGNPYRHGRRDAIAQPSLFGAGSALRHRSSFCGCALHAGVVPYGAAVDRTAQSL